MSEQTVATETAPSRIERLALDIGHRLGAAALLLLVCGAGLLAAHKPHVAILLLAFGCADAALLGGFVSLVMARRGGRRGGEALGTTLFCGAVIAAVVAALVVSRFRGEP